MCPCHKLDFYSLVQRQTERSLLSFQSTTIPIPHSEIILCSLINYEETKTMPDDWQIFSAFLLFRFWQLWLLEFLMSWLQNNWMLFRVVPWQWIILMWSLSCFCNTLISIPQVVDMTSGAGLIQLRIKNLFKVGSRQCFQRKSPLSSRKSFSHFYFTPNYPARPLLTPLNFSLHNLTSTQILLIV